MEVVDRARPVGGEQLVESVLHLGDRSHEGGMAGRDRVLAQHASQMPCHRVRQHEVAVGQTLHQRTRTEAVGAVV